MSAYTYIFMKRRIIQIADSTLLVSLPKKWAVEHNIKKGDEVNITLNDYSLVLTTDTRPVLEKVELNLNDYGVMAPRVIHALYKKGVDEIKIIFSASDDFRLIQESLKNEAVGYDIIEQGPKSCVIKNVSGEPEEFEQVLRRIYLLLVTMALESSAALKARDFTQLKNLEQLETSNNRLTTLCRRLINKGGKVGYSTQSGPKSPKTGPLYFIIESLENIADEYKYMFQYLYSSDMKDVKLSKEILAIYDEVSQFVRTFYELFYKYDSKKVSDLGDRRKMLVKECVAFMQNSKNGSEVLVAHHLIVVVQKVFNMTGP